MTGPRCVSITLPPTPPFHNRLHLDSQPGLPSLISIEADGHHGDDFDVADAQADIESQDAPLPEDQVGRLGYPQPVTIAHGAADLHSSPDDLEGIGCGLGDETGHAAGEELGPGAQGRRFAGRVVGGAGHGGIFGDRVVPEEIAHEVVSEEGHARVWEHAHDRSGEASVEIRYAIAWYHRLSRLNRSLRDGLSCSR